MHRRRVESVAVVALLVVVVGLAAATLGATTTQGTTGTGGTTAGGGQGGVSSASETVTPPREPLPLLAVLGALLLGVVAYGAVRYPLGTLLEVGRMLAMSAVVLVALWLVFVLVGVGQLPTGSQEESGSGLALPVPEGAPGGTEGTVTSTSPELLGLLVAALLGLGLVVVVARDVVGADGEPPATDADEETLTAIGRSAGRAADRLADADADLDNEVYRAWREMTHHLEVDNPGARTPGEFRTAALSAGMTRGDVETLTDLFEAVRYGGADPTDEREETAATSLRRIEERYAGEADG